MPAVRDKSLLVLFIFEELNTRGVSIWFLDEKNSKTRRKGAVDNSKTLWISRIGFYPVTWYNNANPAGGQQ